MAFLNNLFVRTKRSISNDNITVQLDGVLVERFSNPIRVTKNPVELGVAVSDHAIIEPRRYNMDAVVSDTPLGTASIGVIVDNITNLFGDTTGEGLTRSQAAYEDLVSLMRDREPIVVQTGLVTHENMLITNMTAARDKDTSGALFFTMDFEEVIIVETEVVARSESTLRGDTKMGGASPENQGRKLQQEIPEASQSFLAKGLDLISGVN